MSPGFAAVVAGVVADLTAAGVNATANVDDVRTPGVWVGGVSAERATMSAWDYTIDLYLVVNAAGDMRAYTALDELLAKLATMWPLADDRALDVVSLSLPGQPNVPSYRYPISIIT